MSIGSNIKNLREKYNLTQKELAEISGVTDKAVSMWEQDERIPRMGPLQKISDKLGIKVSSILEKDSQYFGNGSFVLLPLLKNYPESCKNIEKDNIKGHLSTDSNELTQGENYAYITVSDDRMAPLICENDTLLVHLKNYINSGSLGLISVDGKTPFIAKIIFLGERVELHTENQTHEKLVFSSNEFKRLKVIGEIKKLVRRF
jgi:repressor LexA